VGLAHLAFQPKAKIEEGISLSAPVAWQPKSGRSVVNYWWGWGRRACQFHEGSIGGGWMGRVSSERAHGGCELGGGEEVDGGANTMSSAVNRGS
jgi:hypothetical protein